MISTPRTSTGKIDLAGEQMAKKSKGPARPAAKTTPVRLSEDAIKWARIASGYTGESLTEYVSRIVTETAQRDARRLHAEIVEPDPDKA